MNHLNTILSMKTKFLIFAALLLVFISCKKEQPVVDYAFFSGKISNTKEKELSVNGNDFKVTIPINEDGTFNENLKIQA